MGQGGPREHLWGTAPYAKCVCKICVQNVSVKSFSNVLQNVLRTQRRGRRPPVAVIVVAPAAPDAVDEASRPRVSSRRVLVLVLVARVIRRPAHHLSAEPAERVRAVLPYSYNL